MEYTSLHYTTNSANQINEIKKSKMKINGIFINQDNSLVSIATDTGYKIYESYNFVQVSEDDEYQDLIGALKIAIPFYESHLVMIVGKDEDSVFPHSHVVLWDDMKKIKIGVILLKEKIFDAQITKESIFILLSNKIMIFNTKDLSYVFTIKDVDHIRTSRISISYNTNPIVCVNIPSTRSNQLKITKLRVNQGKIDGKMHLVISTPFKSIYKYNISKKCDNVIIVGNPRNKVHIYSLVDFQLKFCLDSDFEQSKIINISISKKTKFFSILYCDYNLEVYNLSDEKRVNEICDCMNELWKEELAFAPLLKSDSLKKSPKKTLKDKAKGFLSTTLTRLKGIVFEKNKKSFCKYKFHPEASEIEDINLPNYSRLQGNMENLISLNVHTLVQFDKINELVRFLLNFILL